MTVSCQQDFIEAETETAVLDEVSSHANDYAAYVGDPRVEACRVVSPPGSTVPRGAAITSNLWEPGQTLTVSFIDPPSDFVRDKVIEYARKWEEFANITFDFLDSGNGTIRVAFIEGAGSYSYLGTDAQYISSRSETVNFGWFTDQTDDEEFSRTVVHEFGHVLGLIHEHQHPEVTLDWDREFVYEYLAGYPNYWDEETVDINLFDTYDAATLTYNDYDVYSIMHYPILGAWINSDTDTPDNTELSEGDKEIAGILYPF